MDRSLSYGREWELVELYGSGVRTRELVKLGLVQEYYANHPMSKKVINFGNRLREGRGA